MDARKRGLPAWLVLAVAVALLMVSVRRHERQSAFFGRGFVAGAQAIIDSGYIALDCDSMKVSAHFPPGSDAERWYSLSYLREDVRRFNSDPERVPGPFVVDYDACRLEGVDRYYHRIDLPFTPSLAWQGDVLLSGGRRSAVLDSRSIPQTLEVRPPADVRDATAEAIAWPAGPGSVPASSLVQVRSAARGPLLSELYFVGDNLVLADRRKEGTPYRIRVSGHELLDGRVVRVETGDWVQFSGPGLGGGTGSRGRAVPTYLARVGADSRLASFVRVQNEDVDRLYAAPGLRPFLEPFAQAMNSLVQSGESAWLRSDGEDTVQLTMDQELNEGLQRSLGAWCTQNRLDRRPRAVSVLVMDGFTGAVRGMPSCPTADELTGYAGLTPADRDRRLRNQNLLRHEIGSAGKPFWAAAVASAHPALLDLQVPEHATGPAGSVLGCTLRGPYQDHGHSGPGGWVGMERFLAGSCNRYIVEMATAALTLRERSAGGQACAGPLAAGEFATCFTPPAPGDSASRFRICDEVVRAVLEPRSRFVAEDCGRLKLLGSEFRPIPNLGQIANVEWYFRGSPDSIVANEQGQPKGATGRSSFQAAYLFGRYRIDAWRRLTGSLSDGRADYFSVETGLRFAAVSPEQTNLQLNTVDDLRSEWVSVLLGGATSRWSNFQLAEALSRLMTGRAVQGEFVDSIRAPGLARVAAQVNARRTYPLLDPAHLHDGVRRRVLHGMELVVQEGTALPLNAAAAALRDSLAQGAAGVPYDLFVFAKTGTPAVTKLVPRRRQHVLRQLFRHLRWNAAAQRVEVSPEGMRVLQAQRRSSPEWYRWFEREVRAPLEADPSLFRIRAAEVPPRHPLYLVGDRLSLNVMQDLEVMRQGGVLILGLLAVPRGEGRTSTDPAANAISVCTLDPGLRGRILSIPASRGLDPGRSVALSVAIHVDDLDIGVTSAKAVELANQLMPELTRYFLAQARAQVQSRAAAPARRRV